MSEMGSLEPRAKINAHGNKSGDSARKSEAEHVAYVVPRDS